MNPSEPVPPPVPDSTPSIAADQLAPPIAVAPPPTVGAETVISVADDLGRPEAGVTVSVVHRPGLDGERELTLGITDGLGRVRFTPDEAGTALVRVDTETLPIEIGWDGPPTATVVTLAAIAVAALIAIGFGIGRSGPPRRFGRA